MAEREELSKLRSERLLKYVKLGKIIELGCGTGATLSVLSQHFPKSVIVGLDVSDKSLDKVTAKDLKNVIPVKGDVTDKIFPNFTFDTAIFKFSLHEVYSLGGDEGVVKALTNAYNILKTDGVLIVYEHLKPYPCKVKMRVKSDKMKTRFVKFCEEFQPRKVECQKENEWVNLEKVNCLEFLTKYGSRDWEDEMKETHYFYTLDDFRHSLLNTGFSIKEHKKYKFERKIWREKLEIADVDFQNPESYILIVARKIRKA